MTVTRATRLVVDERRAHRSGRIVNTSCESAVNYAPNQDQC
jgi:hypothetical protein